MRLHLLVEGPSEADLLDAWLRRLLPGHDTRVIHHEGKGTLPRDPNARPDPRRRGLLDQLPAKLRAYGKALDPRTDRVLVLVDADGDDCADLHRRLLEILASCDPRPEVEFSIAIEETEAFYLGDRRAIKLAFPEARVGRLRSYQQDSICGTWEKFQDIIGATSVNKRAWAGQMAPHLGTTWRGRQANRSPSFRHFCAALCRLAGEAG